MSYKYHLLILELYFIEILRFTEYRYQTRKQQILSFVGTYSIKDIKVSRISIDQITNYCIHINPLHSGFVYTKRPLSCPVQ